MMVEKCLTEVTNMFAQLGIGFTSGFLLGIAVFSHAFSRAVVMGLIAGVVIGAIVVDGVDGYVRWATYLPVEMARFAAFWIGLIAGFVAGARFWMRRQML
jgi:fructose-specific phosphotransferase system IIC component